MTKLQRRFKQHGRIDKCVAMHHAIAQKFGVTKSGNHLQHAFLIRPLQICLEADDIVQRTSQIILSKLHHGMRAFARTRIVQPNRFHRPEGEHVVAGLRLGVAAARL